MKNKILLVLLIGILSIPIVMTTMQSKNCDIHLNDLNTILKNKVDVNKKYKIIEPIDFGEYIIDTGVTLYLEDDNGKKYIISK